MKILYCITSSSWGGAQLHVYELCKYEYQQGNEVVFVVGTQGLLAKKVRSLPGVKVIILPSLKRNISLLDDIRATIKLRKIFIQEQPDIIHLHSSKAGTLGRLASRGLKAKVIFTVHGWAFTEGIPSKLNKILFKSIEKYVARFTDQFICVSEYDRQLGFKYHVLTKKTPVTVIHNGAPAVSKNKINHSVHTPVRLVMIARFSYQKDQESLIKAISKLPRNSFFLTFVGDGETLSTCQSLVKKLNLTKQVKFIGFREDISSYLIKNDIYLLTTHYEGLPISVIEAMSYGLPVIVSDVGGDSELVVSGKNGFLVHNVAELRTILYDLINDPVQIKNMGKNSLALFLKKFTLLKQLQDTHKLYQSLSNK